MGGKESLVNYNIVNGVVLYRDLGWYGSLDWGKVSASTNHNGSAECFDIRSAGDPICVSGSSYIFPTSITSTFGYGEGRDVTAGTAGGIYYNQSNQKLNGQEAWPVTKDPSVDSSQLNGFPVIFNNYGNNSKYCPPNINLNNFQNFWKPIAGTDIDQFYFDDKATQQTVGSNPLGPYCEFHAGKTIIQNKNNCQGRTLDAPLWVYIPLPWGR